MRIKRTFNRVRIQKDTKAFELGYRVNVQVITNGLYYGQGKFCKSKQEAEEYINSFNQ